MKLLDCEKIEDQLVEIEHAAAERLKMQEERLIKAAQVVEALEKIKKATTEKKYQEAVSGAQISALVNLTELCRLYTDCSVDWQEAVEDLRLGS